MPLNHTGLDCNWKSLNSENVFSCPIFSILKERLRCPRTLIDKDYFTFEFPDWINIIAITPEQKLVMIKQYRVGSGKIELEIPGGAIDREDTDTVCAAERELLEETGYTGYNGEIIGKVCPNPALQGNTCYTIMFPEAIKTADPEMEDTEDIETLLISPEDIDGLIRAGQISHGVVLNAIHFYQLKVGKYTSQL